MNIRFTTVLFSFILILALNLDSAGFVKTDRMNKKANKASIAFVQKLSKGTDYKFRFDSLKIIHNEKKITLLMNENFGYLPFRPSGIHDIYHLYKEFLGRRFRKYSVSIETMGKEISELIPNFYRDGEYKADEGRLSVKSENHVPLVRNVSANLIPEKGLYNRNIALWHSHGWYYENTLDRWEWQRARVFLTVEDLWTMSFVVPYIAPMLENAGAGIFLPRERDTQLKEIIVDADGSTKASVYIETGEVSADSNNKGFGNKYPFLFEGENPFEMGTARKFQADNNSKTTITYAPFIESKAEYAVYVSYIQSKNNVTDAKYTVNHAGGSTEFLVNQTKCGGTWVYLGTFLFEKGLNAEKSSVVLSGTSNENGKWVSVDAVRFGGGIGNIVRGAESDMAKLMDIRNQKGFETDSSLWLPFSSRRPRYQEGARYYLQYAGMPDTLVYMLNKIKVDYSNRGSEAANFAKREAGKDDYKDDYQSRGEWVNYLMGSSNMQNIDGLNIPVDMALAFHTDAGTTPDSSIIGTLMIYSTVRDNSKFKNGQSKWASRDLADIVQTQVVDDIRRLYEPEWKRRAMWNKQYSEAFRPNVPTLLSELLSHQNFADMALAYDPRFKFDISRAYYKGILKFLATQNQTEYIVQPLPVKNFRMELKGKEIKLVWKSVNDELEPTAVAKKFKIYTRIENGGFDNGIITEKPEFSLSDLKPGVIYSFKITAINEGGESFPSEILACCISDENKKPVLIVNGFDRVCGPMSFDSGDQAGFLMNLDEGVADKTDLAFIGEQYDFNRKSRWIDDDNSGFGSSHSNHEALIVQGNTFDYPFIHGQSFRNNGFDFISMSDEAFEQTDWISDDYLALDIIFGEEKTTSKIYGNKKTDFTLFTPKMIEAIKKFGSNQESKIFISGAYVGSDFTFTNDSNAIKFAIDFLHFSPMTNFASKGGEIYPVNKVKDTFNKNLKFNQTYHPKLYKVEAPDAIEPKGKNSSILFRYADGNKTAATAFNGDYKVIVFGFPFESITEEKERDLLIEQITKYWGLK